MARPSLKADFIRTQPLDMSNADVQRAAKKAGIHLGRSYIVKVRWDMRKQAKAEAKTTAQRERRHKRSAAPGAPTAAKPEPDVLKALATVDAAHHEQLLRGIVVVLGTARVRVIIDALEAQLMGAKGG